MAAAKENGYSSDQRSEEREETDYQFNTLKSYYDYFGEDFFTNEENKHLFSEELLESIKKFSSASGNQDIAGKTAPKRNGHNKRMGLIMKGSYIKQQDANGNPFVVGKDKRYKSSKRPGVVRGGSYTKQLAEEREETDYQFNTLKSYYDYFGEDFFTNDENKHLFSEDLLESIKKISSASGNQDIAGKASPKRDSHNKRMGLIMKGSYIKQQDANGNPIVVGKSKRYKSSKRPGVVIGGSYTKQLAEEREKNRLPIQYIEIIR